MSRTLVRSLLLLLVATLPAPGQTVLLQEDFNSGWSTVNPPAGWRVTWDGDTSSNDWHRAPDLGRNPWPDNPTPYALLDSSPLEGGFDSLISPAVMCTAYNVVTLTCSTFFRGSIAPYQAFLVGWVDGGVPRIIFDYAGQAVGPELQTFNLDWAANGRNVQVAWAFGGESRTVPWWCVDNVTITGRRTFADVGCADILAPGDSADSAALVQPVAVVRNFGTETASFPVFMEIGVLYRESVYVEALAGGRDTTVSFSTWRAGRRGPTDVVCYTALPGDIDPLNDRLERVTRVRVVDVAALAVLQPADTLDSNVVVTPTARVWCSGEDTATFWSFMRIGTYLDSAFVDGLGPEETRDVQFAQWRANMGGPGMAVCSVAWGPDRYASNDTVLKRFFVRSSGWRDASAERVLAPVGGIVESSYAVVTGVVRNHGAMQEAVTARMLLIDHQGAQVYDDSVRLMLAPRQLDTVEFRRWLAQPEDTFNSRLQVFMAGDMNPENDTTTARFWVTPPFHDVAVTRITSPVDTVVAGPVVPQAWVKNLGSFGETFRARFRITRSSLPVYYDSVLVYALAAGDSQRISFPAWSAAVGSFVARCTTALDGDANPANNLRMNPFWVESLNVEPGWHEAERVPAGASGKPVTHGGSLLLWPDGTIFALKGNKTNEFLAYSPRTDSWRHLDSVPPGPDQKRVYKGGCLAGDGANYVYAVKGNKTDEFYRYVVGADSWESRASIPLGSTGKAIKGGTSITYVVKGDTGWCYLLKGYKSEFYRYNTFANRWDTFLPPAPLGSSGKDKYKEGSFLRSDGEFTLYCIKAYYNDLFAFDVRGDTWYTGLLAPFPKVSRSGRSKKVKDGGSGTFYEGEMYCLKGGNTQEFWKYAPAADSWFELDTVPQVGSTAKKKKVKGGGSIVAHGRTVFYALKGNKTFELWRYRIPPAGPGIEEIANGEVRPASRGASLVRNVLFLSPSLFTPHSALFDLTGRKVLALKPGPNNVSGLSPGVYFVRQAGRHDAAVSKVVIE